MVRGEILDKALQIINGERQDQYGNPEDNFEIIGELWDVYMKARKRNFTDAHDAAMKMALMKVARIATGSGSEDSYIDLCGYVALACDIMKAQKEKI